MLLSPQPHPLPKNPLPIPQPQPPLSFPQMQDKRIIQIKILQHPLSLVLHPH